MWQDKRVSVVFPAYNEAENVERAVRDFLAVPAVDEVIDVDNKARDRTAERAAATGPGPMVYVVSPTGRVIESHPRPGDRPANCAFGDAGLGTLYVTTKEGELYRSRNTGRKG